MNKIHPQVKNSFFPMLISILISLPAQIQAGCPKEFPEGPAFEEHIEHHEMLDGHLQFRQILDIGKKLFTVKFNKCDGQGRPATTGGGAKRSIGQPNFIRTSAPEANSCSGCHAQPSEGGGGDIVANVFVLAQTLDPVTNSISAEFSNERNTLGMHGAGPIEMLAREMTKDLKRQAANLPNGNHTLRTKGVDFDVTIQEGTVISSEGVNTDLIIRPFHQAGVVVSLREFSVNAMNHHHGMQAEERFDLDADRGYDPDYDEDGIMRELTIGDITALTLFQAALSTPVQVLPKDRQAQMSVFRGERLFNRIGCASCHKPELELDKPYFIEPNPYNPSGTFADTSQSYSFDMTREGFYPRLRRDRKGKLVVRAYTDLKRHNLCDSEEEAGAIRFFCNEQLDQGRPEQNGRPGREFFLTRKLWDVGNSAPYGHRGDITTITEAILYHGGEGRQSRNNFETLSTKNQKAIINFLKTLQVMTPHK